MAVVCLIWCVSILLALPYAVHMRIAKVQWPCNFALCVEDWIGREDLRSVYGVITAVLQACPGANQRLNPSPGPFQFVLPFAIIGRSYRRIWRFLESRRTQFLRPVSEVQESRKQRLLRMLVRMVSTGAGQWPAKA